MGGGGGGQLGMHQPQGYIDQYGGGSPIGKYDIMTSYLLSRLHNY